MTARAWAVRHEPLAQAPRRLTPTVPKSVTVLRALEAGVPVRLADKELWMRDGRLMTPIEVNDGTAWWPEYLSFDRFRILCEALTENEVFLIDCRRILRGK